MRSKTGRLSSDDQRLVVSDRPPIKPPDAPPELDVPEARIWRSIVTKLPGDWFPPECIPLLKEMCRHIRHADDLAMEMAMVRTLSEAVNKPSGSDGPEFWTVADRMKAIGEGSKVMERLLRMHGYQTERIGNLATKLRLTNQAKILAVKSEKKARDERPPAGPRPWDDWANPSAADVARQ
jgi:hypothetical protein